MAQPRRTWRAPHSCGFIWSARIAAVVLAVMWLMFASGEGFPPLWREPWSVQLVFLGWFVLFVSYVVGWKHHLAGGLAGIGALVFMNAVEYAAAGNLLGPWFLLWGAPPVLYLVGAWLHHKQGGACSI